MLGLKNLRLQATEQDWNEVETILNRLQQTKPDATDLTLLRRNVLWEKRAENAEKLLTAMRDKYPEKTELWSNRWHWLARLNLRSGTAPSDLLAQADKKFGDRVFLRRARGQYLLLRRGRSRPWTW